MRAAPKRLHVEWLLGE